MHRGNCSAGTWRGPSALPNVTCSKLVLATAAPMNEPPSRPARLNEVSPMFARSKLTVAPRAPSKCDSRMCAATNRVELIEVALKLHQISSVSLQSARLKFASWKSTRSKQPPTALTPSSRLRVADTPTTSNLPAPVRPRWTQSQCARCAAPSSAPRGGVRSPVSAGFAATRDLTRLASFYCCASTRTDGWSLASSLYAVCSRSM